MDLYYQPLSGSFAAHVACLEAGITPVLHRVDRITKRLVDGRELTSVAPLGLVPALELPDGSVLTELTAVLAYIAERAPDRELAPPPGSLDHYRMVQWLAFVATELHKKHLWAVFATNAPDAMRTWSRENAGPSLAYVERHLASRDVLVGARFTVADIYLMWGLLVAPHGGIALGPYPAIKAYVERHRQRPSFQAALAIEMPQYAEDAAARSRVAS